MLGAFEKKKSMKIEPEAYLNVWVYNEFLGLAERGENEFAEFEAQTENI